MAFSGTKIPKKKKKVSIECLHIDPLPCLLFKEAVGESVVFSVAAREKRVSCAEKRTPRIVCNYEYAKYMGPTFFLHSDFTALRQPFPWSFRRSAARRPELFNYVGPSLGLSLGMAASVLWRLWHTWPVTQVSPRILPCIKQTTPHVTLDHHVCPQPVYMNMALPYLRALNASI